MRVALVIDERDWHARALLSAFRALDVEAVPLRLAECAFDSTRPHGIRLPGFDDALPDAMLVRGFGGGGFEAVTRRLGLLHALHGLGVRVWNDARAIERCVDKSTTSFLLQRDGIPTPPTWAVEGLDAARAVVARETQGGQRLVCKPLFGAQGKGLRLVARTEDLPPPEALGEVYYLQRYIPTGPELFRDHRLFVVGGEVVGAMTRHAPHWITNVRRGGTPEALAADPELSTMAIRAARSVGAAYAGIDLLRDADGRAMVLEVNSMPGWRGLQTVCSESIAHRLARQLLSQRPMIRPWLERAFRAACADDVYALKPGNVGLHAAGHRMTAEDFVRSAGAAAGPLCAPGASLGQRVLGAVEATRAIAGQNTNLGIVLLCAPLAMAAQASGGLQEAVRRVLDHADLEDARAVFRAIALAAPGGLGTVARHDVRAPATALLSEAMADAAARDSIARQYVTGFADIFGLLASTYREALASYANQAGGHYWAILSVYLRCIATWPDSHVARKHGASTAEAVTQQARYWWGRLEAAKQPAELRAELLAWDADLKRRGINPGTSADLTVATLFAERLGTACPRPPMMVETGYATDRRDAATA